MLVDLGLKSSGGGARQSAARQILDCCGRLRPLATYFLPNNRGREVGDVRPNHQALAADAAAHRTPPTLSWAISARHSGSWARPGDLPLANPNPESTRATTAYGGNGPHGSRRESTWWWPRAQHDHRNAHA